jgi:hypothetical protein
MSGRSRGARFGGNEEMFSSRRARSAEQRSPLEPYLDEGRSLISDSRTVTAHLYL